MRKDYESHNRATMEGFTEYMLGNPIYFENLSGMKATRKNIQDFFSGLRKACLVAAKSVHGEDATCALCSKYKYTGYGFRTKTIDEWDSE